MLKFCAKQCFYCYGVFVSIKHLASICEGVKEKSFLKALLCFYVCCTHLPLTLYFLVSLHDKAP